jgi:hypothetical protein
MSATAPLPYNLLELYRQHRDEVDALTDQTSLFILAYTNELMSVEIDALAGDLNLSLNALRAKLTPLLRGQLMREEKDALIVTALGRRVLAELGFIPPVPPGSAEPPKKPEPPTQPHKPKLVRRADVPKPVPTPVAGTPGWLWGAIAFFATGIVALVAGVAIAILVFFQPQPTPIPTPQIEIDFTADRTNIVAGECALLRWHVRGADWVELNGQRVGLNDTSQVCPPQTTTYALVIGGYTGGSRSVTVNVQPPPPTPISPTPHAQIVFTVDQPSIRLGDCTMLRWNVQGGYSVQLDGQGVERIGQKQVCPRQTATYQLAVDVGDRMDRREVVVAVAIPPPPAPGALQGSVNRAADALPIPNAQIQISGGPSTTAPNGSYAISNLAPGDYSVTASAPGYQSQTQTVHITAEQTTTLNFSMIRNPVQQAQNTVLGLLDCYSFDAATRVDCGAPNRDLQLKDTVPTTRLRGIMSLATPQSQAYESCPNIDGTELTNLYAGEYICVLTAQKNVAVVHLTAIDTSTFNSSITFDWWRY